MQAAAVQSMSKSKFQQPHDHAPLPTDLLWSQLALVDDGLGGQGAEIALILIDAAGAELFLNQLAQDEHLQRTRKARVFCERTALPRTGT
eukprot:1138089-Pelagomonas_calceolata.AAC.7